MNIPFLGGKRKPFVSADAFAALHDDTHRILFRYVYGLTGRSTTDVEDIVAETYERAWKARRRFSISADEDSRQAALKWLMTIARNRVYDLSRRRKTRGTDVNVEKTILFDQSHSPEAHAVYNNEMETLLTLMEGLSADKRDLLTLRYVLGWSVARVAAERGGTVNATQVAIHRTLKQLRAQWPVAEEKNNE